MKIRHAFRFELENAAGDTRQPWLAKSCRRLIGLSDDPNGRVLVAEESEHIRAALGLDMKWLVAGRGREARIAVLVVDPGQGDRGLVSRLVRFAEGIARLQGIQKVDFAPALERRSRSRRRCGRDAPDLMTGFSRKQESPFGRARVCTAWLRPISAEWEG